MGNPGDTLPLRAAQMFGAAPGRIVPVRQFVGAGFDRREVAAWARLGLCDRLLHGLYGNDPHDTEARRLHLPLVYLDLRRPSTQHPSVLSGAAALSGHGVPGLPPIPPLVLVDERCTVRLDELPFTWRRVDLTEVPWTHRGRLRLAAPPVAVADAADEPGITDTMVRVAVDDLRYRGMLTMPDAVRCWERLGSTGARRLIRWAHEGVFEQESEGERLAFERLFAPFHPRVDCQVVLVGALRADFVYLSAALVIEYYGHVHDGRADTDATRAHAFEARGYRVKVVTKSMIRPDTAPGVAAHIQDIRHDRQHRLRTGALPQPQLPPQPERLHPLRTFYRAAA